MSNHIRYKLVKNADGWYDLYETYESNFILIGAARDLQNLIEMCNVYPTDLQKILFKSGLKLKSGEDLIAAIPTLGLGDLCHHFKTGHYDDKLS